MTQATNGARARQLPARAGRFLSGVAAACAFVVMVGCSGDKEIDPPAELVDIVPKRKVDRVWSTGLGGDSERLRLALRPFVAGEMVYAASHDGEVIAMDARNGRRAWSVNTRRPLSAGPEVGNGLIVVGSSDGDIIALDASNGEERWRRAVASEVLAHPLILEDVVIIRTVDGHVEALSAVDGATRWSVEENVPRLTLRGTAPPVLANDRIVAGFDNGKVLAIDPRSGDVLWDTVVNAPRGRTELERLADIDAPARVSGDDIFVVGFQGRVAMLALDSGQIWWARDASSYRGFALDGENLYLTNSDSVVIAMRRSDGAVLWEQDAMKRRSLTAPAIDGDALVVGDFEGYLHWLDKSTGEIVARQRADDARITNAAVATESGVFLQTDSGKLLAYRSQPTQKPAAQEQPTQEQPTQEQPTQEQSTQEPPTGEPQPERPTADRGS